MLGVCRRFVREKTPPRAAIKKRPFTVGRGPVPRHAAMARRALAIVRVIQRSRGTGPRAAEKNAVLSPNDREGQALALRGKNAATLRRAGACPPPCCDREIGPRAAEKNAVLSPNDREGQALALRGKNAATLRRAGACPPPCCDREGQALALR